MAIRRLAGVIAVVAVSCGSGGADPMLPGTAPAWFNANLGGDVTAYALRDRPFHQAARTLSNDELRRFAAGARIFDARVPEPGEVPTPGGPPAGLGPRYVDHSCIACHVDGSIVAPSASDLGPGELVRVGIPEPDGGVAPEPGLGRQVQNDAVGEVRPEASVAVEWREQQVDGPSGPVRVRTPRIRLSGLMHGAPAPGTQLSLRVAPTIVGLGLLEAVPESALAAAADPEDRDGDGISGRLARLPDGALGRFGWKARQPDVTSQTNAAAAADLGLTTPRHPEVCDDQPAGCDRASGPADPELSGRALDDLILYTAAVAPPVAAWADPGRAGAGAAVFERIGCAACHSPTLQTGPHPVEGFAGRTIHPFTDLLLHDLGPGLDDGLPEGAAGSAEWRTAPLWGLGRRERTYGFGSYLHDGRARTIEEAILWHGGEADAVRRRYLDLSEEHRRLLLEFLGGL